MSELTTKELLDVLNRTSLGIPKDVSKKIRDTFRESLRRILEQHDDSILNQHDDLIFQRDTLSVNLKSMTENHDALAAEVARLKDRADGWKRQCELTEKVSEKYQAERDDLKAELETLVQENRTLQAECKSCYTRDENKKRIQAMKDLEICRDHWKVSYETLRDATNKRIGELKAEKEALWKEVGPWMDAAHGEEAENAELKAELEVVKKEGGSLICANGELIATVARLKSELETLQKGPRLRESVAVHFGKCVIKHFLGWSADEMGIEFIIDQLREAGISICDEEL